MNKLNKMKKYSILIAIFLTSIYNFSQNTKIENGIYTAKNDTETINLIVQDGKFHISVFSGDFEIKKDSVFLHDFRNKNQGFFLKNLSKNDKIKSDKTQVTLKNEYRSEIGFIYIGTQNGNDATVYKSFSTILQDMIANGFQENENGDIIFEIDKSDFVILAAEDIYNEKTEVAKFKLPANINDVTIEYTKKKLDDVNLLGTYNEKTKELKVSNSGKNPLVFKIKSEIKDIKNENFLPFETSIQKKWTFPGKEKLYSEELTLASDTTAVKVEAEKTIVFKHFISKNFKEALKHNSTLPESFLVVSFDLKNKNRKSEFDDFIKESEIALSENYYYNRSQVKNQFNYYLANKNDKKLLSKYKIKSDSEIIIFNALGDLIYHTPENLTFNKRLFGTYESAFSELSKANLEIEFDKVLLNKKASTKEVLRMLSIGSSLEIRALLNENLTVDGVKFVKPTEVDIPPVFDAEKTDPDYTTTGQLITDENRVKSSEEVSTPVIEEVPAVSDDYYSIIKNKENLYRLKSTLKTVYEKWEKIVVEYEKSNKIDKDFITVVKQQLNDEGFTKKIFERSSFRIEDYRMLNYVFANYKTLIKETETKDKPTTAYEPIDSVAKAVDDAARMAAGVATDAVKPYEEQYNQEINTVLDNYFYRVTNEIDASDQNVENQKSIKFLLFEYYKKYIKLTDYKTNVVKNYMSVLDNNLADPEIQKEYFEIFEIYFNKMIVPNKSIIESLDANYAENNQDNWITYKNSFANDCNQIAWEIVKIGNNKTLIQKAIKWSETSIEIQKDFHYFFDTLARLYYLNGQKEKAISTQQKAIDLGGNSENGDDYRNVLQELKNGTYTLPNLKE